MYKITTAKKCIVGSIILLVTVNQIAITLYLPSVPHMVTELHTSYFLVQLTIITYVLGYGIAAFFYGPLSDVYGRRKTLLTGLMIFFIGSVIAIFCRSIECLLFARLLQGLGNGSGDVIGRAIMCDVYDEKSFVKAASYISMASPFLPIVAPVIGGYLEMLYSWRASFMLMAMYGAASILVVAKFLPETNLAIAHQHRRLNNLLKYMCNSILVLAKSPIFVGFFIPGVIAGLGDLVYSLMAPFILQNQLGLTPIEFGWIAILPAIGIFVGAFFSSFLSHRFSIHNFVFFGLIALLISGFCMTALSCLGYFSWPTLVFPMLIYLMGVGIIYPSTNAGALMPFAHIAGAVSAVQSSLQTTIVAVSSGVIAQIVMPSQINLAVILSVLATIGFTLFFILAYRRRGESVKNTRSSA